MFFSSVNMPEDSQGNLATLFFQNLRGELGSWRIRCNLNDTLKMFIIFLNTMEYKLGDFFSGNRYS